MDGDENLPRATVGAFVKENLDGMKCSNEFIEFILKVSRVYFGNTYFSKEYISVIADEANKICLEDKKKTIAPYYIYEALKKYQLDSQIKELESAKQQFIVENHKSQNEMYKDPETVKMLTKLQKELYEQSRNKTEAEIQCLNVIQSGEDYKKKDLQDITKGPGGLSFGSGLNSQQNKENISSYPNRTNDMDEEDEDDDYEN